MVKNLPSKINDYNVYNEAEKLIGMGPELPLPGGLHHFLEAGAVQVAAREALVLKDHRPVGAAVPEGGADIGPAQLHLVPDAFPLAGEAGFPGIDGDNVGIWLFLHGGTPFTGCYMRGRDIP